MNKGVSHTNALKGQDSDIRATPQKFFDELNKEFNFTLDPCATKENAKCQEFFTTEDNGLEQSWSGRVFCNPPYSNILPWIEKGVTSVKNGDVATVVFLVPSRTGTDWWHKYAQYQEIRWIRGRLKFDNMSSHAPFDCCLVIVGRENL